MAVILSPQPTTFAPASPVSTTPHKEQTITVLLTTFAGLGLPRTLSIPTKASTSIHDVLQAIYTRLPRVDHPLIITTTSNKQLLLSDNDPILTLLSTSRDDFLPLRLSARLCGGKGGFGSQLRAAGGRMSSRKNKNQQNQNLTGSNRNLDGRRLRTVDEAKKLAEYLATKPDMDKKAKEAAKQRWQDVIAAAERTEEAIRSGKTGASGGRLDAEYVESKELAEEKTKQAVLNAMREGMLEIERTGSESSIDAENDGSDDEAEEGSSGSSDEPMAENKTTSGPAFFGWDDDEDDDSDDEEEEESGTAIKREAAYDGKGKSKVV